MVCPIPTRRGFILALGLMLGAAGTARAQTESPLAGKVVHLYNPFQGELPLIDLSGTGYDMIEEGGNWYRFDFNSGNLQPWMNSFLARTGSWKRFGKTGMTTTDSPFGVDVFGAGTDVWILPDTTGAGGPPVILTKPPGGTVHLFNPWPANGPRMVLNGKTMPMNVDRGNCGWYLIYLPPVESLNAYFTNAADGQAWGAGGLDDKTPFDLKALLASNGNDLWIADRGEFYGSNPGKRGSCTYQMAATVHDLAMTHPDYGNGGGLGMVKGALGADHKPVPTDSTLANHPNFGTWFNSDPAKPMPLKGAETCVNLEMGKADDGLWEYDSHNVPVYHGFFPIDDFNTLDANKGPSCTEGNPPAPDLHNFGFCMETHATFVYQKGQIFDFRGDDDVWVFINNKLALDIGGIHPATPGRINLDTLGLVEGQTYPWDFFFCERQMCGSSLRIKTTIFFKQQRALDHAESRLPDGSTRFKVIKRVGGTGACGSSTEVMKEVPPGPLTFVLYRAGGDSIRTLPKGASFGGITVADSTVSVDTSKVSGLAPGEYRIIFYETSSPGLRDQVTFTVPAHNLVEFDPPYAITATLGDMVKVVAADRFKDSLVAGAVPWTPSFPAGPLVYADSARAVRVAAGAALTTAPTGLDTLWVMGDPAAQTDQTYTFSIPGSAKTVKITFTLPPLDLPKAVSAAMYDDDGDGRGDRLEAVYDRDIAPALPASVAYRWPASGAPAAVPRSDLAAKLQGGKTLVFRPGPFSPAVLTSGQGAFESHYDARGKDSIQIVPIEDRIGPVIRSASMHLGKSRDTLILEFSEPLAAPSRAARAADLFGYRLGDSSAAVSIDPRETLWARDGTAVSLVFDSDAVPEPKAGDFVRLNDGPGLAADAAGNRPGSQTRFHPITGDKRAGIQTVTYREVPPDPALFEGPVFRPSREPANSEVRQAVDKTGRMGALLEAVLADYAVGDGTVAPEPGQVALEYSIALFTNHGVPVASEKKTLFCTDDLFEGDCRTHRGRVFVGWNYKSESGAKAGTGAYVAVFEFKITVQGKKAASGGFKQIWGLLRKG